MNPRVANQTRTLLGLLDKLGPHLAQDRLFPERVRSALADRRFGSRDRRIYRELLFAAFRHWPWWEELRTVDAQRAVAALLWLCPESDVLSAWRADVLEGWPATPNDLEARRAHLGVKASPFPPWWAEQAPAAQSPAQALALLQRGPVWLRVQREPERVAAYFAGRGWPVQPSRFSDGAWPLPRDADITRETPYLEGWVEVQDIGSQRILASAPAQVGERWLDACAGAGGKTLQLATLVGPTGKVVAYEPRKAALLELADRARRGQFTHIEPRTAPPAADEAFDGVLVDAPCTGSGTWRRMPHLKAQTKVEDVGIAAERQLKILSTYARHVRSGGRLVYATCSLCTLENEGVVRRFLEAHPAFRLVAPTPPSEFGCGYGPADHDGDGFFAAYFLKT